MDVGTDKRQANGSAENSSHLHHTMLKHFQAVKDSQDVKSQAESSQITDEESLCLFPSTSHTCTSVSAYRLSKALSGSQTSGGPMTNRSHKIPSLALCSAWLAHSSASQGCEIRSWATCLLITSCMKAPPVTNHAKSLHGIRIHFDCAYEWGRSGEEHCFRVHSYWDDRRKIQLSVPETAADTIPGAFDGAGTSPNPSTYPCFQQRTSSSPPTAC